jgi:hypothetical protein
MLKSLESSQQGENTKESLRESFRSFSGMETCVNLSDFVEHFPCWDFPRSHFQFSHGTFEICWNSFQICNPQVFLPNTSPERFSPHHVVHFSFRVVKMLNNSFMHIVTYFVMKKAFNGKVFSLSPPPASALDLMNKGSRLNFVFDSRRILTPI